MRKIIRLILEKILVFSDTLVEQVGDAVAPLGPLTPSDHELLRVVFLLSRRFPYIKEHK